MSSYKVEEELTCKPLDSYAELMVYVKDLPPWRSLCKELTPHSEFKISNRTINNHPEIFLDEPETFCHINPDEEDPPRIEKTNLPKTLVCHDMANGYHDDSYIDGTEQSHAYTFYNWAGIDIFCYFSHHLITIPPLSWINVGHAHGVKVIGTLITEWNEGVKFWDDVLQSESMFQNTASALVAIAKSLKFDGWLLNVENKIAKPKLLLEFVQHLRFLLHQEIPHAELIWYDSVTIDGHLNWQNGLNDKNKAFFDACTGIFTNYSWSEFDITSSAIEAGERLTDLYIGIDVWGRNFHGGGHFNTQEAIKVAHDEGCSLAIFAPAWTHEAMSTDSSDPNYIPMADHLDKGQQFLLRDRALWGSFWPYLSTRLPCTLPFKTSFCRGLGKKRRLYGEVLSRSPWYNLRHQHYQPNSAHGPHGYVLSSEDVIRTVSTVALCKDTRGILRMRDSFQNVRVELFSQKPRPKEEPQEEDDEDDEQEQQEAAPDTTAPRSYKRKSNDQADQPDRPSIQKKAAKKRTVKECLKEFFAGKSQGKNVSVAGTGHRERDNELKPTRRQDSTAMVPKKISVESEPEELPEPTAGGSNYHMSSGRSMQTMSVNLRLGTSTTGARTRIALAALPQERECFEVYQDDSFTGGSCLCIHPSDKICHEHRYSRLFHCDFLVRESLVVCVATKPLPRAPDQYLTLRLHTVSESGVRTRVVLVCRSVAQAAGRPTAGGVMTVAPLDPARPQFKALQRYLLLNETGFYVPVENHFGWTVRYLLLNETGFYVPVENHFGWTVRYYEVPLAGCRVTSVNVRAGLAVGPVLLGHLGLCHKLSGEP